MSDEASTKPTLETLSKQMEDLRTEMRAGFAAINHMLERMDISFDPSDSTVSRTHSEVMFMRASFKEFRGQVKAPADAP